MFDTQLVSMFYEKLITTHRPTRESARSAIAEIVPFILFNNKDINEMVVFSDTLYHEEYQLHKYDFFNVTIEKYTKYNIEDLYSLSINEFDNLTHENQNALIRNRAGVINIKNKLLKNINTDGDNNNE